MRRVARTENGASIDAPRASPGLPAQRAAARLQGVRDFDALTGRGQLGRLRRLGRRALARYPGGLDEAPLILLRHEQNATFRVDASSGRYVLRISRPVPHFEASVASEMAWL